MNEANGSAQLVEALKGLLDGAKEETKRTRKGFENIEAAVEHSGSKIILPGDPRKMTYKEARDWLTRMEQNEEQVIVMREVIDAHPWDGAFAFMRALKEMYGWASPVPTPGFFGPQPPRMVSIEVAYGEKAQIFWGAFKIPGFDFTLHCGTHVEDDKHKFSIIAEVKKKYSGIVLNIANLTRDLVVSGSIYKGKALRLDTNDDGDIDYDKPPKFMNLKKVDERELVFSTQLTADVQDSLWTPIEYTVHCRKHKVPLKRGVLLEGPYGTGKTLCATVTAKKCEENGWTFITVPQVKSLEAALRFASGYQPAVVFVEDVDREMSGERTVAMDDILNTVDGIISKGSEIMVVLTSNHVENINRAMLRPGRLDAVLRIGPPDAGAVERLLRVYGGKLIKKDAPLTESGKVLAGRIPAVIRECVERAKLSAIGARPGAEFCLIDEDIARAARGMEYHLKLLAGPEAETQTDADKAVHYLTKALNHGLANGHDEGLSKAVGKTVDGVKALCERFDLEF